MTVARGVNTVDLNPNQNQTTDAPKTQSCCVCFNRVTGYTVIQVWVNAQGRNEEEAIADAREVLNEEWGRQIVIDTDTLTDADSYELNS